MENNQFSLLSDSVSVVDDDLETLSSSTETSFVEDDNEAGANEDRELPSTDSESSQTETNKEDRKTRTVQKRQREKMTKDIQNEWKKSHGKFTFRIIELLADVHLVVREFLMNESQMLALPGMPTEMRQIFVYLAERHYNLTHKARGHHKSRCLVLYKTSRTKTSPKEQMELLKQALQSEGIDMDKIVHDNMTVINDGHIIGSNAKPLDETNIGFRLLKSMGWDESQQKNNDLIVTVKKGRAGLK